MPNYIQIMPANSYFAVLATDDPEQKYLEFKPLIGWALLRSDDSGEWVEGLAILDDQVDLVEGESFITYAGPVESVDPINLSKWSKDAQELLAENSNGVAQEAD